MLIYDVVVLTAPHCVVVRLNSQTDVFFSFSFSPFESSAVLAF